MMIVWCDVIRQRFFLLPREDAEDSEDGDVRGNPVLTCSVVPRFRQAGFRRVSFAWSGPAMTWPTGAFPPEARSET